MGADGAIVLWSIKGEVVVTVEEHQKEIICVAFSPDGKTILTANKDKTIKLWSFEVEFVLVTTFICQYEPSNVSFSPDGKTLLIGYEHWDLNGKFLNKFDKHRRNVTSVAFSPDGKMILTSSFDATAKLLSLDGQLLSTFSNSQSSILYADFSPDGKKIVTVDFFYAKLWTTNGKNIGSFSLSSAYAIALLPDNTDRLLVADRDGLKLLSIDGMVIKIFEGYSSDIYYLVFSPNGKNVLTRNGGKTAKLWSFDGNLIATFKHQNDLTNPSFFLNGKNILTYAEEKKMRWSLEGELLEVVDAYKTKKENVFIFSPDGKMKLSISGSLFKAILYSVDDEIITTFITTQFVNVAVFSPNSKMIAMGDYDGIVKLWSIDGQAIITLPPLENSVRYIEFTKNNKRILTSDNIIARFTMLPEQFLEETVFKFSNQALRKAGVQLEPSDLSELWQQGEKLTASELKLIGKAQNQGE